MGEHYARKVGPDGCVKRGNKRSYVQKDLAGRHGVLEIDATTREPAVWQRKDMIKRPPLKELSQTLLAFEAFADPLRLQTYTE